MYTYIYIELNITTIYNKLNQVHKFVVCVIGDEIRFSKNVGIIFKVLGTHRVTVSTFSKNKFSMLKRLNKINIHLVKYFNGFFKSKHFTILCYKRI